MAAPQAVRTALAQADPAPARTARPQMLDPLIAVLERAADRSTQVKPTDQDKGPEG